MKSAPNLKVLLLFVLMIAFLGVLPAQVMAADEVKIGVILPLSGPVAPVGKTAKSGLDFAVKEINEGGGIKSMGGAKIKLIYADSTGKPEVGLSEAESLILKEKVAALMGAYQSSVTYTSTEAAERHKTPYLVIISIMDKITERGFKYVFRPTQRAQDQSAAMVKFLQDASEQTGKKVKTVALVYENTDWGQASAKVWKENCGKYGIEIVADESYPHAATDLTPLMLKLKRIKPDAVLSVAYISDMILLVKTAADVNFNCMAWVGGGGGEVDPKFTEAVGDLANYIFSVTPWQLDLAKGKPWIAKVNEEFKAAMGTDLSTVSAMTYSNMYTMLNALERAGSTDHQKIRDALAATNITKGPAMILPFEKIEFNKDGQNPYQRMVVSQFQNQKLRVISPKEFVASGVKMVWPMPMWSQR